MEDYKREKRQIVKFDALHAMDSPVIVGLIAKIMKSKFPKMKSESGAIYAAGSYLMKCSLVWLVQGDYSSALTFVFFRFCRDAGEELFLKETHKK